MKIQSRTFAILFLVGLASVLVRGPAFAQGVGIRIPTGITLPVGVAVDPSLNRTYIPGWQVLGILDGATNSITIVETGITFLQFPSGPPSPDDGFLELIAVNPVNHRVYLLGFNELGIFDGVTQTLVRLPLNLVFKANYLAVNPVTDTIYIPSFNSLVIVDGETLTTSTIPLPIDPVGVAVNAETNQVYVRGFSSLLVLDGATLQVTATIGLGSVLTWGLAVNPATNKIYLPANTVPDNRFVLIAVDGVTHAFSQNPVNRFPAGLEPGGEGPVLIYSPSDIAVNAASGRLYIPALTFPFNRRVLVEINGDSNLHQQILPTGSDTAAIAVNPESGLAYLVGFDNVIVIRVDPPLD